MADALRVLIRSDSPSTVTSAFLAIHPSMDSFLTVFAGLPALGPWFGDL